MASVSSAAATTATTATTAEEEPKREEMVYKTKLVQFRGRTTPIILQNDNGPCPLLAICNVLLLKNRLDLSPDIPEVSQEKLLLLVADLLINSNSNLNNKDEGYVKNQQQNISDAIDLLPKLATGIDVNIKFRRFDDFEFTRECAIFDLLGIPLCHGWIVDPQDHDTANAIGSKSYNTLMGELVALAAQNIKSDHQKSLEDDFVDFAAATTAALGVPSPCLSRGVSFDDPPFSVPEHHSPNPSPEQDKSRKGDLLEEAELMRALKLSEGEVVTSSVDDVSMDEASSLMRPQEITHTRISEPRALAEATEVRVSNNNEEPSENEASTTHDSRVLCSNNNDQGCIETSEDTVCSSGKPDQDNSILQPTSAEFEAVVEEPGSDLRVKSESTSLESMQDNSTTSKSYRHMSTEDKVLRQPTFVVDAHGVENKQDGCDTLASSCSMPVVVDEPEALTSNIDGSEPLYEGEDSIMESGTTSYQNQEPVYEGEVVLLEQDDKGTTACDTKSSCEMTTKQGDLIHNFLDNSASQLTIYGLFCLQDIDGIKEKDLCVFFRNNHFNTMYKFEGALYILVTDQGYIDQPDLVWEKLNEVNGDTLLMTGNFKEFKVDSQANSTWDEQNAVSSTADYLANIDTSVQEDSSVNYDWELAMALQQQEFEQQTQRNNNSQQEGVSATNRLVTGPQVSRSSEKHASSSSKQQEVKASKDKCTVM